ncbi:hypothetical protein [Jannaschia formosa]|uniref:hypothetical protein n=1 Tax=Jannaschia formosa TaxID=2259592 RepID=UPI000E1BF7BB|nr:hypothetical protein [Jannaschia formosa]TFL17868.1 hypothetical protein DR046_11930 [Jannaschia formosa]
MSDVGVKVVVDDAHLERLSEVADMLTARGMRIATTLEPLGVILGEAEETSLGSLGEVEGVLRAEREGTVRLPPMDDDIPQ